MSAVSRMTPEAAAVGFDADALIANLRHCVVFQMVADEDADGQPRRRLTYVSPSIEPLFGLTADEAMADVMRWYSLADPSALERVMAREAEATETMSRFSVEVPYLLPHGRRVFDITSTPMRREDGALQWDGVAIDITDRVEARDTRERLATMIEATEDFAAIIAMPTGSLVFMNAAGKRMLDLPADVDLADVSLDTMHLPEGAELSREVIIPAVIRDGVWTGKHALRTADGRTIPVTAVVMAHRDALGDVTHISAIMRDISERVASETRLTDAKEQTEVALREVSHRVKNIFALVPALITLSARGKTDVAEVVTSVQQRIMALARSHAMTLNAFSEDKGVVLDALIRAVLEPYEDRADAFTLDGPAVRLASRDGNAMALMLHELATNAAKYGALVAPRGRVTISWRVASEAVDDNGEALDELRFEWSEQGGPAVSEPTASGFGTRLIDRMIMQQSGTVERDWRSSGVAVRVRLPLHGYGSGIGVATHGPNTEFAPGD